MSDKAGGKSASLKSDRPQMSGNRCQAAEIRQQVSGTEMVTKALATTGDRPQVSGNRCRATCVREQRSGNKYQAKKTM